MALSYTLYTSTASSYATGFKYLSSTHVKVLVATTDGAARVILSSSDYTVDDTLETVTITPTIYPTATSPLKVYRETPGSTTATKNSPFVDFQNGTVLSESDLDNSTLQSLYLAQETRDYTNDTLADAVGNDNLPSGAVAGQMLHATGDPVATQWGDIDTLIQAASANTAGTLPRRDSGGTPKITTDVAGNASTATALATGGTLSITGDVTYTSPTFTGASVTAAATVKIGGNAVLAETPADNSILTYNTSSTRWESATPTAAGIAVFVVQKTGTTLGDTAVGDSWQPMAITHVLDNATAPTVTLVAGGKGVIKVPAGTWRIEWSQTFHSIISAQTKIVSSTVATATGTHNILSVSATEQGVGTCIRAEDGGTSVGYARVVVTGADFNYFQLQAYPSTGGTFGYNNEDSDSAYYYTILKFLKEQ